MRIAIVEDNAFFRDSLINVFRDTGLEIVFEGPTLPAQDGLLHTSDLAAAVLDLRLGAAHDGGLAIARELRSNNPETGILLLSAYERSLRSLYIAGALSDLPGHGGIGYHFKDRVEAETLTRAVKSVASGRIDIDPHLVTEATGAMGAHQASQWTDRQNRVMELVSRGFTNDEISAHLHASAPTIERDIKGIADILLADGQKATSGPAMPEGQNRRVRVALAWLRFTGQL